MARNAFQPPKSFGSWFFDVRKNLRMTLQQVADKSGLQSGTLSRIERDRVKVTLTNALRICNALKVTPAGLYQELGLHDVSRGMSESMRLGFSGVMEHQPPQDSYQISEEGAAKSPIREAHQQRVRNIREHIQDPAVITRRDVQQFVALAAQTSEKAYALLTETLERLAVVQKPSVNAIPFTLHDAQRLLQPLPFYRVDVPYPDPETQDLLRIYGLGGMVIAEDATQIIQKALYELTRSFKRIPADLARDIERLRGLAMEQTLLDTVLAVDALLNQKGTLLEQYWVAHQIQEEVRLYSEGYWWTDRQLDPRTETEFHKVRLLIKLHRWLFVHGITDISWMREYFPKEG